MLDKHYLVVANYQTIASSQNNYDTYSYLYIWDDAKAKFVHKQSFQTKGAWDWEYFNMDGINYLVVANQYSGTSFETDSIIYKYNETTTAFENFQIFVTKGAVDIEYFTIYNEKM